MLKYLLSISLLMSFPLVGAKYHHYLAANEEGRHESDAELVDKIHDKLNPGWFSRGYEGVTVEVKNGNVTLKGTIPTASDKESLEKDVRNMEGVRSLTSKLSVVEAKEGGNREANRYPQDTYSNKTDYQLNLKIRDNISGILWDSYDNVSLNTTNGAVVLEGSVDSLKDQQDLMNKVQKIEGVKSVKSNLRVEDEDDDDDDSDD